MAYKFTKAEKEQIKQLITNRSKPYSISNYYGLIRKTFRIRVEVVARAMRAAGISLEVIFQHLEESTFSVDMLPIAENQKLVLKGMKKLSETYCPHPYKKIPKQPLS